MLFVVVVSCCVLSFVVGAYGWRLSLAFAVCSSLVMLMVGVVRLFVTVYCV